MILDEILERTKIDLERKKTRVSFDELGRTLSANPFMPRDVKNALKSSIDEPIRIIAEVKKASPSKGIIRENFDPIQIAIEYEKGGANAFSVVTEPHFFKGNLDYISFIRRYTNTPILRKDFIIDRYQILEALVFGADFVLLIARVLKGDYLRELLEFARHLGLEALVEIHDEDDLKKAIFAGADIIGINQRNLIDFSMNPELFDRLIPLIPNNKIIVAESGLKDHKMLCELGKMGVDAFLIGEHFMRCDDIKSELKRMKFGENS